MKRTPRKLVLHRETLRTLEDCTLRVVQGGTMAMCTGVCDTNNDCSSACFAPTNIGYVCG